MSDKDPVLNDDGLIGGQEVDFSTLMRIKRQGVQNAQPKPTEPKPKTKPKRTTKSSVAD